MTRQEYAALRAALRATYWTMSGSERHFDMADSRLMVQHTSHAEGITRLRARAQAIRQSMPACTDPLGFGAMHRGWQRRRLATFAAMKREAYLARDDRRYARAHDRYFAFYKQTMRNAA